MEIRQRKQVVESDSPTGSRSENENQSGPNYGKTSFPTTQGSVSSPRFFSPRLFLTIATYFLIITYVFERLRVKNSMAACQWENWENWHNENGGNSKKSEKSHVVPHRVAFIADPQLVDDHTYPSLPRLLNYLIRRMSDNYHYINYRYLQEELEPHTTFFIGDLFDGGRDWEDEPWLEEFHRFNRIFPENTDPNRKSYRGLPGNHDIGFQTVDPVKVKRFAAHFGDSNAVYILGNHTFVQLDTISLSHEDPRVHTEPRHFLETCKAQLDPTLPRILLTHVPLFRDPRVETCGPGRESSNPFPLMRGVEYQTVIDHPFSEDILKNLKPVLVFSGDDHDYCDMTHVDYADNTKLLAREISCKTNSMTNGIKRPAVQLLSLNNPQEDEENTGGVSGRTYETTMCYLPSPYLGVKVYFLSLAFSMAMFYFWFLRPQLVIRISRGLFMPCSVHLDLPKRRFAFAVHSGALVLFLVFLLSLYNQM